MKLTFPLCFALLVAITAQSQKKTFIRVFDENGEKTNKGFLVATSDSSLTVLSGQNTFIIPINEISKIKLRRSMGHTILITTILLGTSVAVLGAATADPSAWFFGYSAGEGFAWGLLGGSVAGAWIGSIISLARNRPVFMVNNQKEKWMKVKEQLQKYLPAQVNKK